MERKKEGGEEEKGKKRRILRNRTRSIRISIRSIPTRRRNIRIGRIVR